MSVVEARKDVHHIVTQMLGADAAKIVTLNNIELPEAIDRLILEVQAEMPCCRLDWNALPSYIIYETCSTPKPWPTVMPGYVRPPEACPSCTARMKLNELKVQA